MSGLEVSRRLSDLPNPPRIVILTMNEDPDVAEAAEAAGASGYVLKRNLCSHLVAALRHELKG
jgi:two-component system, NarL family, nitrate/nitrite response regulator NarL